LLWEISARKLQLPASNFFLTHDADWPACGDVRAVHYARRDMSELHELRNEKLSCCCDSRSYSVLRTVYWQTIKPVSAISLRTAGTQYAIQRVEFINTPKLYLPKR